MPCISVIVPVFNGEATLKRCVDSVLAQSFEDWELILVDDGSTDGTNRLARELAAGDPRIRLLTQRNRGVSAARNLALERAEGEYAAFLDADDWLAPDCYGRLIAALRESGADCAACGHYLVWPDGREEFGSAPLPDGVHGREALTERLILPLLNDRLSKNMFNGFSVRYLYPLRVIREFNIRFSGAYLEDELFLIEFFSRVSSLCVVNEGFYYYLQNPASATRRYMAKCVPTFLDSLARKRELVSTFGLEPGENWERNCAWAGLLIAVGNEFAPGSGGGLAKHRRALKELCAVPAFADALKNYRPENMNRNKSLVALLLRGRLLVTLCLLYAVKNRGRK